MRLGRYLLMAGLALQLGVSRAETEGPLMLKVGSLTLKHCNDEYNGYCGNILQKLDRHGSLSGMIHVGFEFYPHTDNTKPSEGVILAQEGGPGFSTTGSRDGYVRMLTPLRDHRDILLIDKRGTGFSSAIDCPALQNAYLPNQADVAACAKQLGKRAWLYRSADAADDVAAVMAALGFKQADYYGDSYGTWFGQVLAVTHPDLLRTMVLDSAYPVVNDNELTEVNNGQHAMDKVCQRSPACAALGSSATARFAELLSALRTAPIRGSAPGSVGEPLGVVADPQGLFLVIANAGNAPTTWRDLDAAGRAWLHNKDPLPLLRLIAEARDSYSGGGDAVDFSVGLADAVSCAEYGALFNQYATLEVRKKQYLAALQNLKTHHNNDYAPFIFDDAIHSQMDAEAYDTCLPWPDPAPGVTPGQPIPPGARFPKVPVLVLSGELDTVTSPSEGHATAKLFPVSTYIETTNLIHESAIGDAGYFVPPNGEDLSRCIGPIVRQFISSGGDPGDISCVAKIRPIRTVPAFALSYKDVAPVDAAPGNAVDETGLRLASTVAETVGDAVARYYVTYSGVGGGLRGGRFGVYETVDGYKLGLKDCAWAEDVVVSGKIFWNQISGEIAGTVDFTAPGHSGTIRIGWHDRETDAVAHLTGTIDGKTLEATRLAP